MISIWPLVPVLSNKNRIETRYTFQDKNQTQNPLSIQVWNQESSNLYFWTPIRVQKSPNIDSNQCWVSTQFCSLKLLILVPSSKTWTRTDSNFQNPVWNWNHDWRRIGIQQYLFMFRTETRIFEKEKTGTED